MPYKDLERRRERARERYHEGGKKSMLKSQKVWRTTIKGKFSHLKSIAKSRNLEMLITEDEYILIINEASCEYCNSDLPPSSYGLDRIDNDKGYTVNNVVPCCGDCNTVRNNILSHEEMKVAMKAVLKIRNLGL